MAWPERYQPGVSPLGRAFGLLFGVLVFGAILAAIQVPPLQLSGSQQVPAVQTTARASSTIAVLPDLYVAGVIETTGIAGTAAHVHVGAAGTSGPAIITLEAQGANRWAVPAGAHLSGEQYMAFEAGGLYVDMHSAAHPGGELRLQLVGS